MRRKKQTPYTPVPNELLDALRKNITRMAPTEVGCLHTVIRYTYGFHRKTASLSYSFIAKDLGITVRSVRQAMRKLEQRYVLQRVTVGSGQRPSEYAINSISYWFGSVDPPALECKVLDIEELREATKMRLPF